MNFRSISIAPRAALGFGVIALIVFILGGFALVQMSSMHERSGEIEDDWAPSLNALSDLSRSVYRLRATTLRALLSDSEAQLQRNLEDAQQMRAELDSAQNTYEKLISSRDEQSHYDRFKAAESQYLALQSQLLQHMRSGDRTAAMAMLASVCAPCSLSAGAGAPAAATS